MDIVSIFKSKTRKELFRLYFTNPEGKFYLRELERILGIPVSMIRKELLRLENDGIFISAKRGNLTYFYLNKTYALFEELKRIVFKTVGIRGLLKQTIKKIKGIETAFIYGSFAKNEESAKSDIDVFIIGKLDENKLVKEIAKLEKILKREINYSLYTRNDLKKKKKARDSFITDLFEGPKVFLTRDKNDL
ncbi:MAG: nucleotidyltransferase domain-containing protein [Candidatus Omnitrophica bacterium]|nr:nucleotidyltransferase domain-containing protein [Candidatus Omnitrophota bacterium]